MTNPAKPEAQQESRKTQQPARGKFRLSIAQVNALIIVSAAGGAMIAGAQQTYDTRVIEPKRNEFNDALTALQHSEKTVETNFRMITGELRLAAGATIDGATLISFTDNTSTTVPECTSIENDSDVSAKLGLDKGMAVCATRDGARRLLVKIKGRQYDSAGRGRNLMAKPWYNNHSGILPHSAWISSAMQKDRPDPLNVNVTRNHVGTDYAVECNSELRAPADGTVTLMDVKSGYGQMLDVAYDGADKDAHVYSSRAGHLAGYAAKMENGHHFRKNDVLAYTGGSKDCKGDEIQNDDGEEAIVLSDNFGRSTGPHLHWEQYSNGLLVNSVSFADKVKGPSIELFTKLEGKDLTKYTTARKALLNEGLEKLKQATLAQQQKAVEQTHATLTKLNNGAWVNAIGFQMADTAKALSGDKDAATTALWTDENNLIAIGLGIATVGLLFISSVPARSPSRAPSRLPVPQQPTQAQLQAALPRRQRQRLMRLSRLQENLTLALLDYDQTLLVTATRAPKYYARKSTKRQFAKTDRRNRKALQATAAKFAMQLDNGSLEMPCVQDLYDSLEIASIPKIRTPEDKAKLLKARIEQDKAIRLMVEDTIAAKKANGLAHTPKPAPATQPSTLHRALGISAAAFETIAKGPTPVSQAEKLMTRSPQQNARNLMTAWEKLRQQQAQALSSPQTSAPAHVQDGIQLTLLPDGRVVMSQDEFQKVMSSLQEIKQGMNGVAETMLKQTSLSSPQPSKPAADLRLVSSNGKSRHDPLFD